MSDENPDSISKFTRIGGRPSDQKGLLDSATIRNVFYLVMASVAGFLLQHESAIVQQLIAFAPDWMDAYVQPTLSWVTQILVLVFGVRSMQARVAVGDIKGLYKK